MRVWPVPEDAVKDGEVTITGVDARHITLVLRKKKGDPLTVSVSGKRVYKTDITTATPDRVTARVVEGPLPFEPARPDITLCLGIGKQKVMELVAQKAVELGCIRLVLLATDYAVGDTVSPQKLDRMRKIVHEACKQSGSPVEMELDGPVELDDIPDSDLKLLLYEGEHERTVRKALQTVTLPHTATVVIGPPSGWSDAEVAKLAERGFVTAGMGGLILRSETAAISMLSIINYHYGRM